MSKSILGQFIDSRITVVGRYERHSTAATRDGTIPTTLMQDCFAEIEGEQHDLGHCWFQFADELKKCDLTCGTKVRCSVRVKQYKKYREASDRVMSDGMQYEIKYSLAYPTHIEILSRPEAPQRTPLIPPEIAARAVELEDDEDEYFEPQADEPVAIKPSGIGSGKKVCPSCGDVMPSRRTTCHKCGNDFAVNKSVPPEGVDKLGALQALLQAAGGVDETREVVELIVACGGTKEVRKFLKLLE